ncbi:hypothetical protein CC79DRAFT_1373906 [Sarocladium strictum]
MSKVCSGKPWGYIAPSVPNAPKCISICRQNFLETLLSTTKPSDDDETFARACETLSDKNKFNGKDHPFWRLYCCDAQRCGVDNVERLGEDPNINWIINTCSNIGFSSIIDPGPPDSTYTCPYEVINDNNPQCQLLKDAPSTTSTTTSRSIEILTQDTMIPSITRNLLSDPTISSIVDPSLTSSTIPTQTTDESNSVTQKYSVGEQVAIAVSVVVGIVALAAAILCIFRIKSMHKRRSQAMHAPDERSHAPRSSHFTPSTPPPSLRGANGEPLTPPPRLRERRLLPSSLSVSSWTSSGFLESPLSAPMKAKLVPRREEMRRAASIQAAPLLGWAREVSSIHSGNSSYTASSSAHSGRTRSELVSISSKNHIRHPSRVHSLASPGPAPNKKLPPTPTSLSPRRTLSPTRHGEVGVAIGIVGHNPASGVTLSGPSRDLCELAEEYERETRSSGGSWSGKGGGAPGITIASTKMQANGEKTRLGEDDLQKMGGGY